MDGPPIIPGVCPYIRANPCFVLGTYREPKSLNSWGEVFCITLRDSIRKGLFATHLCWIAYIGAAARPHPHAGAAREGGQFSLAPPPCLQKTFQNGPTATARQNFATGPSRARSIVATFDPKKRGIFWEKIHGKMGTDPAPVTAFERGELT